MDRVNPILECVWHIEEGVRRGESVRDSLLRWTDSTTHSKSPGDSYFRKFHFEVLKFLRGMEASANEEFPPFSSVNGRGSQYRESLFQILAAGNRGEAILADLLALKVDLQHQLELDMKSHVETLPFKMLIPLLFLLFPSFLLLLFGPITKVFLESL